MEPIIFKYRSRQLTSRDIELIKATIDKHYAKGRSKISRILCECWGWVQPSQSQYTFIPFIVISGGCLTMTRDEAQAILDKPRDEAVDIILALAEKADKYEQLVAQAERSELCGNLSPTTPSGMIPPYLKPARFKRHKKPGFTFRAFLRQH